MVVKYAGAITTTGNSQAIRFEQAFFRALEIPQGPGRVIATILPTGNVLLSFDKPEVDFEDAESPYLGAFLQFVESQFVAEPTNRLVPFSTEQAVAAKKFAAIVPAVGDDEEFPDDII